MNISDFLLVELTWVETGFLFICGARRYIRVIYLSATCKLANVSMRFPIKGHVSPTLPCPCSHLSLTMLFLLFVYYLAIDASPISSESIDNHPLAGNHCTGLTHCRTIWNIIWSCLVTIFSCTWVAVHPNIPCPKKREANGWVERYIWNPLLSFAEHRLPLFIYALLVPEYVLAWAIRQFFRAREIASDNKGEFDMG